MAYVIMLYCLFLDDTSLYDFILTCFLHYKQFFLILEVTFFPYLLQGVFGLLSLPAGLVILVGMMIQEPFIRNFSYKRVSNYLNHIDDRPFFRNTLTYSSLIIFLTYSNAWAIAQISPLNNLVLCSYGADLEKDYVNRLVKRFRMLVMLCG